MVAQLFDSREEGGQHGDVNVAGEPLGYGDAETQGGVDDGGPSYGRSVWLDAVEPVVVDGYLLHHLSGYAKTQIFEFLGQ